MILLFFNCQLSIVNRQLVEQLDIHIDCFPYLHQADIFVGCMGTGGVSRSDLHGREVHEGLVAQSRRTERLFSHHDGTAYERMLQICTGGVEAEAAGFYFAADLRFDQFEQFFVGNSFVRISTVNSQRSGTTLCCVPAWIIVTLIFTGPRKSLFSGN